MPIRAVILVSVTPGMLKHVLDEIEKLKLIQRYATITGEYDILLEVKADNIEELHDLVLGGLDKIKGIHQTNTHIILKDLRSE